MKTLKLTSIIIFSLFFFFMGCDKDDQLITDPITGDLETVDIKVVLPEESDLDLSSTVIVSLGESFEVSNSGDATILVSPIDQAFISLQDREGGVIFMGFIDEDNNELSIKSSAEASLYFALSTLFRFKKIRDKYFNEYDDQSDTQKFHDAMKVLFLEDKNFMEKESFIDLVQLTLVDLIGPRAEVDLSKGVIVDSDEKSGISIINEGLNVISFQSRTRRRTHAFIYKTATKKEGSREFVDILTNISGDVLPDKENEILTTDGFTNTIGTFWNTAVGKGQDNFIKNTLPISLPLNEDEVAAKYEVRVIGFSPISPIGKKMTDKEIERYIYIQLETIGFDFIFPLIGTILNFNENLTGKFTEADKEVYVSLIDALVSATPSTAEPFANGDVMGTVKNLLSNFASGFAGGGIVEPGLKSLLEFIIEKLNLSIDVNDSGKLKKLFIPLVIVDALLQLNDSFVRILGDAINAKNLENWEVLVTNSKVTLTPRGEIAKAGSMKLFEITIPDSETLAEGQSLLYEAYTTAKYGNLFASNGAEGKLIFFRNNKFFYNVTANNDELSSTHNIDSIKVKVYIEEGSSQTLIGKDSTVINIVQDKWKIAPAGVTIPGGVNLKLRVTDAEGLPIVPPEGTSIKVKWYTSGKYGLFNGVSKVTETPNGTVDVLYESLDKDVKNKTENFIAKIYYVSDSGIQILQDQIDGNIKIDNEENTISFPVSASNWESFRAPEAGGERVVLHAGFQVPVYDEAISYKLQIVDYNIDGNSVNGVIGKVFTWTNQNTSAPIRFHELTGKFGVTLNSGSVNTISSFYDVVFESVNSAKGQAVVTITLED